MQWTLSSELTQELERYESTYRVRHVDGRIKGQILDRRTNRVYAEAEADSEQEAVEKAIVEARGAERPKTPADIMAENQRLREENERLKSGGKPEPSDNGDGKPAGDDDPVKEMTPNELKQALQTRELPVPEGHPNSNAWREEAEKALRESLNAAPAS